MGPPLMYLIAIPYSVWLDTITLDWILAIALTLCNGSWISGIEVIELNAVSSFGWRMKWRSGEEAWVAHSKGRGKGARMAGSTERRHHHSPCPWLTHHWAEHPAGSRGSPGLRVSGRSAPLLFRLQRWGGSQHLHVSLVFEHHDILSLHMIKHHH